VIPPLATLRRQFPITAQGAFLDHAAVAALPEPTATAIGAMARRLADVGLSRPERYALVERVREQAGRLIEARANTVAFVRSTTYGLSMLAAGLDWTAGDNVVTIRGEYPANVYPWMNLARVGVETRLVEPRQGAVVLEDLFARVDARTRLVSLSFVEFWNGFRNDLDTIGRECRRLGILFAVDAIQGLGALQLSVAKTPIDYLAAGAQKWLLGPQAIGIAYAHPDVIERIHPPVVGTNSVVRYEEYFDYDLTLPADAHRLEEASPNVLGLAGLEATLDLLSSLDSAWIEKRVVGLAARLRDGLTAAGYGLVDPQDVQRSGIISFRHPRRPATELYPLLGEAGFRLSQRRDFLRASPHFYNSEAEIDALLEHLSGL
jgi:selenocysteine lyase/cysteine desulfurase